ncbi:hypothetical protein [Fusibacter sp. JL216-2]|uniref:hypothetical protein n=1 Tax=Fusibacter sp. JL216-2 TaxID=3071453 RepID=UPI003D3312BB
MKHQIEDEEGNEIYDGAELTFAHELAHAVRGAYGFRNEDLTDDEVNEDEEARKKEIRIESEEKEIKENALESQKVD